MFNLTNIVVTITLSLCIVLSASAKEYLVADKTSYYQIAEQLKAGDTVILANGSYVDFEILLSGKGTEEAPITLTAESKGKVILSGQSNLRLAGEYLVASGLIFKNGYTPSSAVIEFRKDKQSLANHSRVTEMVIDNYSNPDKRESDYWVALFGKHNRFDHNHLVGKRNKGVTVAVRLNTPQSQENYHRIDHNYFGHRPTFGSNGGETLRIGTSHYSLSNSYTLVENNYFEKTNGEVEIVSVKSGKNTLRGNVFYEARGTLTMRHGNDNVIEENVFIGNGIEHTGGIRVINKGHTIRNNYLEGLTGYRFGSGFTVMNGVPNSPINRYHQVDGVTIEHNSFVNVQHIQLAAGSDAERSAVPINSKMNNNLIINEDHKQPFTLFDDVSGLVFSQNIANTDVASPLRYGISKKALSLTRLGNGLLFPVDAKNTMGAKRDLSLLRKQDSGVTWYAKTPTQVAFGSGKEHLVNADVNEFLAAVNAAKSGDVLILAPGEYDVAKLVVIDKVLTIKAQQQGKAEITYQRSALFEIHDGGSLALDGLHISGENSPDYSGNTVVRTKKWGMTDNYRFEIRNSLLTDFDVNHSFHFFQTGKVAFADDIVLKNNHFDNFSGDILRLNSELEDLGIYNAEYVTVADNTFSNIKGSVVKLYRGGSDESTFGPHLLMKGNTLKDVGFGKRNKTKASVFLHGVQVTDIKNNQFVNSAPISVEHTVGEPKTVIAGNTLQDTIEPIVKELRSEGPHTAKLKDNHVLTTVLK